MTTLGHNTKRKDNFHKRNVYLSIVFFLEKDVKYVKKAYVACREFIIFKYVVIVFFRNKTDGYIYISTSEILKTHV